VRLIFFGTGSFALPALEAMVPHVVLAVSQPDRPAGRGLRTQASPVKRLAESLAIPVATPEKARSPEFVESLRALEADALLVASYGQILSQKVLDSARCGGINLHGSLLPAYRGAAPIQRAILAGEPTTGITVMQMDRGMDTGDMIAHFETPIGPEETYGELQERLAHLAAGAARHWLPRIVAGDAPRTPQDEAHASLAPKISKEEGEVEASDTAATASRKVRAFNPEPGAWASTVVGTVGLHRTPAIAASGEPGTLGKVDGEIVLFLAEGALALQEVQPEGKKRMSGRDFINGARLRPSARLLE
jgi:methionyl-tRNA formyltransferase